VAKTEVASVSVREAGAVSPALKRVGSAAVLIVTLSPASARLIAVVRPMAPAPITRTSMSRPYPVASAVKRGAC